ncbi:MAG TPA: sigma-70 family RNA polymerase sigma factor [Planctomycetota bacterium]|nr:sigma-70 family RNA polymerase sigma factor [Planctomycetota bacterium]
MGASPRRIDQLWHEYQRTRDERVKGDLVRACTRKVYGVAKGLRSEMGGVPRLQDLVDAGMVGLMEAFERFDPSRGVYFETWCTWRVLGSMRDDQRKAAWATEAVRLKAQRLRRAADEMAAAHGRPPSDDELAAALGVSPAEVAGLWRHVKRRRPLSLDATHAGAAADLDPALVDHRPGPAQRLLADEARLRLREAVKALPDKQRYTLLLYYFEKLTMAQIGLVLDVTESRVCQLHKKALATLTQRLGPRRDEFLDALGG